MTLLDFGLVKTLDDDEHAGPHAPCSTRCWPATPPATTEAMVDAGFLALGPRARPRARLRLRERALPRLLRRPSSRSRRATSATPCGRCSTSGAPTPTCWPPWTCRRRSCCSTGWCGGSARCSVASVPPTAGGPSCSSTAPAATRRPPTLGEQEAAWRAPAGLTALRSAGRSRSRAARLGARPERRAGPSGRSARVVDGRVVDGSVVTSATSSSARRRPVGHRGSTSVGRVGRRVARPWPSGSRGPARPGGTVDQGLEGRGVVGVHQVGQLVDEHVVEHPGRVVGQAAGDADLGRWRRCTSPSAGAGCRPTRSTPAGAGRSGGPARPRARSRSMWSDRYRRSSRGTRSAT